jgi:hypothetical protein
MKLKKASKLATLLTAGAMLFSPLKAQDITIRTGDLLKKTHWTELGEPLQDINVILRNLNTGDTLLNANTDMHGEVIYHPNRIIIPRYKDTNLEDILRFTAFDIAGRNNKTFYGNNLVYNLSDLPSGAYVYKAEDNRGEFITGKFVNLDRTLQGLNFPVRRIVYETFKTRNSTDEIIPIEILIRDEAIPVPERIENNDYLGRFYDFKDTLNYDNDRNLEFNQDLIPVWEIDPDTLGRNYRNSLHEIKHMTETDPNEDRYKGYLRKWLEYPFPLFYNRNGEVREGCDINNYIAATDSSVRAWEYYTSYQDYGPLDLVQESDSIPEGSGIRMDYITEGSSQTSISWRRQIVGQDTFSVPTVSVVYIGNSLGENFGHGIIRSTSHELGHAIPASYAHALNNYDVMGAGGAINEQEGLTMRAVVLLPNFYKGMNNNLED